MAGWHEKRKEWHMAPEQEPGWFSEDAATFGDRLAGARKLASELLGAAPPAPEALHQLEVAAAEGMRAVAADIVSRTLV